MHSRSSLSLIPHTPLTLPPDPAHPTTLLQTCSLFLSCRPTLPLHFWYKIDALKQSNFFAKCIVVRHFPSYPTHRSLFPLTQPIQRRSSRPVLYSYHVDLPSLYTFGIKLMPLSNQTFLQNA